MYCLHPLGYIFFKEESPHNGDKDLEFAGVSYVPIILRPSQSFNQHDCGTINCYNNRIVKTAYCNHRITQQAENVCISQNHALFEAPTNYL